MSADIHAIAGVLREHLPADQVLTEPSAVVAASRLWNAQVSARPAVVARCRTTADVQAAVRAARSAGLPLSVLGGDHDCEGDGAAESAWVGETARLLDAS